MITDGNFYDVLFSQSDDKGEKSDDSLPDEILKVRKPKRLKKTLISSSELEHTPKPNDYLANLLQFCPDLYIEVVNDEDVLMSRSQQKMLWVGSS